MVIRKNVTLVDPFAFKLSDRERLCNMLAVGLLAAPRHRAIETLVETPKFSEGRIKSAKCTI